MLLTAVRRTQLTVLCTELSMPERESVGPENQFSPDIDQSFVSKKWNF